jgi:hypothetical protein
MKYCPRCGVSRTLASEHRWDPGGNITLTRDPTHRMTLLDNDALENIFDSISDRIGLSVNNIVKEAKRKSSRHFMDAVLSGLLGVFARNFASARVYERLGEQVSSLGLGHAQVIAYRRHRFLEGKIANAYNAPAMAGDICGAFDSVESCVADVDFDMSPDGTLHVQIDAGGGCEPGLEGRFSFVQPPVVPGRNIFELCPVCRAPIDLGRQYSFDLERGVIKEMKTGHRAVIIGVIALRGLFDELTSELGEEIPGMIMNIEKERVKNVITEKGKELDTSEQGYMRYMKTLQLRGLGNGISASFSGETLKARVDNPYYEPLIAGFIAGFYEATTGRGSRASWTPADSGYTEVTVEPE